MMTLGNNGYPSRWIRNSVEISITEPANSRVQQWACCPFVLRVAFPGSQLGLVRALIPLPGNKGRSA